MSVDIKVNGKQTASDGRYYWAHEATAVEDSTGTTLVDNFGGVGTLTVTTDQLDNSILMQGLPLEATFDNGGTRKGTISGISATDGEQVTFTADTVMQRLNRTIAVPPHSGGIRSMLQYVFARCGITDYSIESDVGTKTLVTPGWKENAWQKLKECAAVYNFEIAEDAGKVVVRRVARRVTSLDAVTTMTETVAEGTLGLFVETHFYDHRSIKSALVYPAARYDQDAGTSVRAGYYEGAEIISVTPGTVTEFDVPMQASLTSVDQPECKRSVSPDHTGSSVYTVMRAGGVRAINPATWEAKGGKVTVKILPDTETLRVTVDAGANDMAGAPYQLALDSGHGAYSTLRIVGTGVQWTKTRLRMSTGISEALTDNEIASTTDSMFVNDYDQAMDVLLEQAQACTRAAATLTATLPEMSLPLGQRAGAIIKGDQRNYRVRTATTNSSSVQIQAEAYTTAREHQKATAGMTCLQVQRLWGAYKIAGHNLSPLGP